MGNKSLGLYDKFYVQRTDGSSAAGKKHHGCSYFVLDLDHDPFALSALGKYADDCESEYPLLAADLRKQIQDRQHELERAEQQLTASQAECQRLREALRKFPQFPKECPHDEEASYCDACRHTWEMDVIEWHSAALDEPAPARTEKPKWTQTPPTEQGEYWHWDGNPDIAPFALSVMWSGTVQKCFVCIKDVSTAPFCDEYGGWWQRIPQPPQPEIVKGGAK